MTALFSAHSSKGTQKSALPGSFAHRAPLDAGEERGPDGKPPPSARPPQRGLKWSWASPALLPRVPRKPPVRFGSVPAVTPHFSARLTPHSPCGHLPSSRKTRGRSPRRSRSREEAIAAAPPVAPRGWEERASRRAGPPRLGRAGGSGENSGLQMIRKYPVTWGVLK